MGNKIPQDVVWAADNGRFGAPEKYSDKRYLNWLSKQPTDCLFATAPDVVGNHEGTVAMSAPMLAQLRREGRPAAFCAQDGAVPNSMPWDDFDVLFIGGSTRWKISAAVSNLCQEAQRRHIPIHVGRVNSFQRLKAVTAIGADSVDGTFLKFGPDKNITRLLSWLDELYKQPILGSFPQDNRR
ncbi:MAG: hypothetical protein ACR2PS_18480 [Pseudomonadales bacterium]